MFILLTEKHIYVAIVVAYIIDIGSKIGVVRPGTCEVNKHSSPGGRLLLLRSFHHLHDSTRFEEV